jgi:hypothetical protein
LRDVLEWIGREDVLAICGRLSFRQLGVGRKRAVAEHSEQDVVLYGPNVAKIPPKR